MINIYEIINSQPLLTAIVGGIVVTIFADYNKKNKEKSKKSMNLSEDLQELVELNKNDQVDIELNNIDEEALFNKRILEYNTDIYQEIKFKWGYTTSNAKDYNVKGLVPICRICGKEILSVYFDDSSEETLVSLNCNECDYQHLLYEDLNGHEHPLDHELTSKLYGLDLYQEIEDAMEARIKYKVKNLEVERKLKELE